MKYTGSLAYSNSACIEASIRNYYDKKTDNSKHYVMEAMYPKNRDEILDTLNKLKKEFKFELILLDKNDGFRNNLLKFLQYVKPSSEDLILLSNLDGMILTKGYDKEMFSALTKYSDIKSLRLNRAFKSEDVKNHEENLETINPAKLSEVEFMLKVTGSVVAFRYDLDFLKSTSINEITKETNTNLFQQALLQSGYKLCILNNMYEVLDPFVRMEDPEYLLYKRLIFHSDQGVSIGSFEKFLNSNKTYAENKAWYDSIYVKLTGKNYSDYIATYPEPIWA
jgi:hypothetical protein